MSSPRAIHVYRSNRTEVLTAALADLLADPAGGPLDPEWMVVQGRGMAVWLGMELSRQHGVWAGGAFLYPRNFVQRAFQLVLSDDRPAVEAYVPERLRWAVLAVLEDHLSHPAFARLRRYVAREDGGRRRHQLARRIADTFDQYLTYRPDMVLAWERGEDVGADQHGEGWQPVLWRALVARIGAGHTASLERDYTAKLADEIAPEGMPARVTVFGLVSLPPMYVRVLAALSQHCDVHWFMPSPARGYWAEDVSGRQAARALASGGNFQDLHLDHGNPMLASFGRIGADMIDVMSEQLESMCVAEREPPEELYVEPDDSTLLGRLQADVLHSRAGEHQGSDATISLHACHGPMREVEVLHDQLLALLADGGDIRPHDVVVMTPDVQRFAPLIEAVFERDRGDQHYIPYSIADRAPRSDCAVIDAFIRILGLVGSRARASDLLDLLALAPVQEQFGIASEEVSIVASWVKDSGVRWGIDAAHRSAHGQPPVHENTWRFGIDRLLLGYAMAGDGRTLFAGALPYDEIEGQSALLAGKLAAFSEALFDVVASLAEPRPIASWCDALSALVDRLLAQGSGGRGPADAWQHQRIRDGLASLRNAGEAVGYESPLGIEVVRAALEDELDAAEPARGFLSGGVTFCAMVPMRSVPFRVVCMLGMSDGEFPRSQRPVDFDLMAKAGASRAGDRSRRDDDRYLFLEALLAARERVIITYTGQSIRDDTRQAPSVVVGDLVDYLVASHGGSQPRDGIDDDQHIARVHPRLLTRHPLQPFSPRYFDPAEPELFSHVRGYRDGAERLSSGTRTTVEPFFDDTLPVRVEDAVGAPLALADLLRFFENPVRHLMKNRLGIDLRERSVELSDREPVELDALQRYALGDTLLSLRVDGVGLETTRELARASGLLAPGTPGICDHDEVMAVVEPIAEHVRALREGGRRPGLSIDHILRDGTPIVGELGERWAKGLLRHQYARVTGKQLLSQWIRQLALCWAAEPLAPRRSFLVGRGRTGVTCVGYVKVDEPERCIAALVELYRAGSSDPLPLFPKSGFRYALRRRDGKSHDEALRDASNLWRNEEYDRDAYLRRVFGRDAAPLQDSRFAELACAVFDPLLDHMEDVAVTRGQR